MYQKNKQANKDILEMAQSGMNTETKVFDLNSLDDLDGIDKDFESMTIEELEIILNEKKLSRKELSKAKKILKKKIKNA